MKKNKKQILLTIIAILISTIMFTNRVDADQVMGLKCNITDSTYNESYINDHITRNDSGEQIFAVFTDNTGKQYWNYLNNIRSLSTVPTLGWINGKSITEFIGMDEEQRAIYMLNTNNTFNEQYCPKHIVEVSDTNVFYLMDKVAPVEKVAYLENPRYIIYSYTDKDGNERIYAEGYTSEGAYAFVGPDIKLTLKDEITGHQQKLIESKKVGYTKYFKVDEFYDSLLIAGNGVTGDYSVCEGETEEWCKNHANFKILVSGSNEGKLQLKEDISNWVDNEINNGSLEKFNDIMNLTNDEEFMNTLTSIKEKISKGEEYELENIDVNAFINKLDNGVDALRSAYSAKFEDCGYTGSETDLQRSITSCLVYSKKLGIINLVELAEKQSAENMLNQGHIISMIYNDVGEMAEEALKEKNYSIDILDSSDDLAENTELMYTAIAYLKSRADKFGLDEEKIKNVYEKYVVLVEEEKLNIYPVVDCETLLGEDLIKKINSYLNIIKIAVPIIVIGLGIADFTKAIFAGEEDMKKAQKQFIKRLGIAMLIFLTPTLLNLLLSLANKVWIRISPDSCGIL